MLTAYVSSIKKYECVAFSNNFTLSSGITQYALKKKINFLNNQYGRLNKKRNNCRITATAVKTMKQTVRESLKRALTKYLVDRRSSQIKSSMVPKFRNKGNKMSTEANNSIMEPRQRLKNACARKPKVSGSGPAASYVQRWALCSNRPANV